MAAIPDDWLKHPLTIIDQRILSTPLPQLKESSDLGVKDHFLQLLNSGGWQQVSVHRVYITSAARFRYSRLVLPSLHDFGFLPTRFLR